MQGEKNWRVRLWASRILQRLDRLNHKGVPLLGWSCDYHEATNIEKWPMMRDWPAGRVLTAFHRWFWA